MKGTNEVEAPYKAKCDDNTDTRNGGTVKERRPPRDFVSDTYRTIPATSSKVPTTRSTAGEGPPAPKESLPTVAPPIQGSRRSPAAPPEESSDTEDQSSPASSPHRSPR